MVEDHDDWKLGDEGDPTACPSCGKRNRAGLTYCTICGSPLAAALEADPESFRTIGEAMGGTGRPRRAAARHSLRGWTTAVVLLLLVVAGLTWLHTREEPFRLEDWTDPVPTAVPAPTAAVATRTALPTRHPPTPVRVVAPVATAEPEPERATTTPVVTATERPTSTPRPRPTRRPTARPTRVPRPVVVPPPPRPTQVIEPDVEPVPTPTPDRPRSEATERPSLGTDLQEATRAYRQAVAVHNDRVDEYNALADEIQRRNAWDDSQSSVELRRRLDRAREAVESARVQAEVLRARMESVRARYR